MDVSLGNRLRPSRDSGSHFRRLVSTQSPAVQPRSSSATRGPRPRAAAARRPTSATPHAGTPGRTARRPRWPNPNTAALASASRHAAAPPTATTRPPCPQWPPEPPARPRRTTSPWRRWAARGAFPATCVSIRREAASASPAPPLGIRHTPGSTSSFTRTARLPPARGSSMGLSRVYHRARTQRYCGGLQRDPELHPGASASARPMNTLATPLAPPPAPAAAGRRIRRRRSHCTVAEPRAFRVTARRPALPSSGRAEMGAAEVFRALVRPRASARPLGSRRPAAAARRAALAAAAGVPARSHPPAPAERVYIVLRSSYPRVATVHRQDHHSVSGASTPPGRG